MRDDALQAETLARESYQDPLVVESREQGHKHLTVYVREVLEWTQATSLSRAISERLGGRYVVGVRRVCPRCLLPPCSGACPGIDVPLAERMAHYDRAIADLPQEMLEHLGRWHAPNSWQWVTLGDLWHEREGS